jgi:hypothetical protein
MVSPSRNDDASKMGGFDGEHNADSTPSFLGRRSAGFLGTSVLRRARGLGGRDKIFRAGDGAPRGGARPAAAIKG